MSEENFCVKSQQSYLSFNEDRNADWLHILHLHHELGEQATRRLRLVEKMVLGGSRKLIGSAGAIGLTSLAIDWPLNLYLTFRLHHRFRISHWHWR
jgi:hypothetical protein